jgi:hypothetical protein
MEGGAVEIKEPTPDFIQHVFKFDEANKNEFTNMMQYTLAAMVPVIIILKAVKHLFPEEDETKGTLEILIETVGQIVFIMSMLWFCDKFIRYFPTYSGTEYTKFSPISFVLPFVLILSTLQTKMGGKIEILVDRVMDLWHGKTNSSPPEQGAPQRQHPPPVTHHPSQADSLDTSQILPQNRQLTSMPQMQSTVDFNNMYQDTVTPLQNTDYPPAEPMPANEMGGFSGW